MSNKITFLAVALMFLVSGAYVHAAEPMLPDFESAIFSDPTTIDNPWYTLPVGVVFSYEGESENGRETETVENTGDTKEIMGISAVVQRDLVYLDGELIEDTRDYLAQDDEGNVWYLGEDVDNYEDGVLVDHEGSWLAGEDGAQPGFWITAHPKKGDVYYQEFLKGEAEDVAQVMSLNAKVKTDLGVFKGCLKTKDTTRLEPGVVEYKYYCLQEGMLVQEVNKKDHETNVLIGQTGS